MEQAGQNRHDLSLAALIVLGDAVLILPGKGSGKYLFLGAILAIMIAFLLYALLVPILRFFLKRRERLYTKFVFAIFAFPIVAYAFYYGALCWRRFVRFAAEILLPHTHKIWIFLIFASVVLALTFKGNEVLLKFSLLSFVLCGFAIALFIVLSVKDFKISNIAIYSFPKAQTLAKESVPFLKSITAPAMLFPVYQALCENRVTRRACFGGLSVGSVLLLACFANCLLLFGVALSARFDYPLYSAVSTVTVGPLFTRLDGAVYALFFLTTLIKTAFCFRLVLTLFENLRTGKTRRRESRDR